MTAYFVLNAGRGRKLHALAVLPTQAQLASADKMLLAEEISASSLERRFVNSAI